MVVNLKLRILIKKNIYILILHNVFLHIILHFIFILLFFNLFLNSLRTVGVFRIQLYKTVWRGLIKVIFRHVYDLSFVFTTELLIFILTRIPFLCEGTFCTPTYENYNLLPGVLSISPTQSWLYLFWFYETRYYDQNSKFDQNFEVSVCPKLVKVRILVYIRSVVSSLPLLCRLDSM